MSDKGRNFATIVYPDSAPNDWMVRIEELHVPVFISPLHTDEGKKEHYHVMFCFNGVRSAKALHKIFLSFGGVGCEQISDKTSYARYLCHLDSDDKMHYNPSDVVCYGGANYAETISSTDKSVFRDMILEYMLFNRISDYRSLLIGLKSDYPDLVSFACKEAYWICQFLRVSKV